MKHIKGHKVFAFKGERLLSMANDEDALEHGLILKSCRILHSDRKVNIWFTDKLVRDTVSKAKKFSHETIRRMELPSED